MASTLLAKYTSASPPKTAATGKPGAPPGRRAKGEKTRRKILTATFSVIARDGIRMVSHRVVAAEAKVQLSLTTYYFKDIDTMIEEAFQQFMERMRPDLESLWSDIFNYLDGFSARELKQVGVREAVCEQLADYAANYIIAQYTQRPDGLAVEQIFFTEARLSAPLRKLGMTHRRQLLVPLVRLCTYFNRVDPALDAELLLDTITALEYQGLALPRNTAGRERVHALVKRQLGWVLGLKRA